MRANLLLEGLFWTAAGVGLWLLTLSSVTLPEVLVAIAAAVPSAALAVAARRAVGGAWAPRPAWMSWLLPLPVAVVGDTVRVLRIAAGVLVGRRVPSGEIREVRLPRDRPAARWHTRRATAAGLVTAAPGTVVLDVDGTSGRMLLHSLGSGRPAMEEVVRR